MRALLQAAVVRARVELQTKGPCAIDTDTAVTWAGRAFVAYEKAAKAERAGDWMRREWIAAGDLFAREASEHAATAELEGCTTLNTSELITLLREARAAALKS